MSTIVEIMNCLQECSSIDFNTLDEIKRYYPELCIHYGLYKFGIYMPYWDEVLKIDRPLAVGNCRREWTAYQDSKRYGIEKLLLRPTFCGVIKSTKQEVFRQPRVDVMVSDLLDPKKECFENQVKNILKTEQFQKVFYKIYDFSNIDRLWLAKCVLHYDEKFTKAFIQWVLDTGQEDLHSRNIGYRKGLPVILDFAN